jgi:predicted RNA-binding protein
MGDTILMYTRSEVHGKDVLPSTIMGEFRVTKIYEDGSILFVATPQMGDEVLPYQFRLKPVKIFIDPIEFKPLIPELGFVTNKTIWSGHFRQAMGEIPEEDYPKLLQQGKNPFIPTLLPPGLVRRKVVRVVYFTVILLKTIGSVKEEELLQEEKGLVCSSHLDIFCLDGFPSGMGSEFICFLCQFCDVFFCLHDKKCCCIASNPLGSVCLCDPDYCCNW